jgi:hypothetical protein
MPKTATTSAERLAAQFAAGIRLPDLDNAINQNTKQWDALVKALREQEWRGTLSETERLALYDKIAAALPHELQLALGDYSDAEGLEIAIGQEAAFLVGIHVGLRLAGGAR